MVTSYSPENGHKTRNASMYKRVSDRSYQEHIPESNEYQSRNTNNPHDVNEPPSQMTNKPPTRNRRLPSRFRDYHM